jgi:cytidine deaminase
MGRNTLPLRLGPKTTDEALCAAALRAAKSAFAPVSGFAVGAALLAEDDQIFLGQNQENLAFDAIHAEMAALTCWNAAGRPPIKTIAIAGLKFWPIVDRTAVVTPCGGCRQWLFEAALSSQSDLRVLCCNGDLTQVESFAIAELLPGAFKLAEDSPFENWAAMKRRLIATIG